MMHPLTKDNIDKWISFSPELEFTQKIWSHDESREFLKEFGDKFGLDILTWFDREPDGRYKSDIWRLCVLYEYGGVYVDIDQEPLMGMDKYIDFNKIDFCGVSNMGLHNVSNGFIYAKKGSNIIKNNIYETVKRCENNGPKGGCHVMGIVITDLINGEPLKMPLGEVMIGNENCLFLHEIGDESLNQVSQEFFNSFGVYADDDLIRVMNSRYSSYYADRYQSQKFIKV